MLKFVRKAVAIYFCLSFIFISVAFADIDERIFYRPEEASLYSLQIDDNAVDSTEPLLQGVVGTDKHVQATFYDEYSQRLYFSWALDSSPETGISYINIHDLSKTVAD